MSTSAVFSPRELTKQLAAAGVTITKAERKTWLKLTPGTIKRKIKNLAQNKNGNAPAKNSRTLNKNTHKLGEIIDGLTSYHSYELIAITGENAAVSVKIGFTSSYKVKFYPTASAFGFTEEKMVAIGGHNFVSRSGDFARTYERMFIYQEGFEKLVALLNTNNEVKAYSLYNAMQIAQGKPIDPEKEEIAAKTSPRQTKPKVRVKAAAKAPRKKKPVAKILKSRPHKAQYDPGN